jgi:hypothetical protein
MLSLRRGSSRRRGRSTALAWTLHTSSCSLAGCLRAASSVQEARRQVAQLWRSSRRLSWLRYPRRYSHQQVRPILPMYVCVCVCVFVCVCVGKPLMHVRVRVYVENNCVCMMVGIPRDMLTSAGPAFMCVFAQLLLTCALVRLHNYHEHVSSWFSEHMGLRVQVPAMSCGRLGGFSRTWWPWCCLCSWRYHVYAYAYVYLHLCT